MTTTRNGGTSTWRRIQPPLAFIAGVLTLGHEVVIYEGSNRPYILLCALTLMGFGSLLKADELLQKLGVNVTISRPQGQNRSESSPPAPPSSQEEGAGP